MEWYNQKFDKKGMKEWSNDKLKGLTNGNNKEEVNGVIKLEPCIAAFGRVRTEPLKAIIAVITKQAPSLKWKPSWKRPTLQDSENDEYIAWLAIDHLDAVAKIYVDRRYFDATLFEDEFKITYGTFLTKKAIGHKGKGKGKGGEGELTPDDFLKAVGLTTEGKGSYTKIASLTLRTKVPFAVEGRCIPQTEFYPKYSEHLSRLAKRILLPDMML